MTDGCLHTVYRNDTSHQCGLSSLEDGRCTFHTTEELHRTRDTVIPAMQEAASKQQTVYEADISGVDLTEFTFPDVEFVDADFRRGRLQNADLTAARFTTCDFGRADLRQADLRHCNLSDSSFRRADLREANLQETQFVQADFSNADLREATLTRTNLKNASLQNTDLRDVNLDETILEQADLRNANLQKATLSMTNLQHADLREGILSNADISMASMEEVRLDNARLNNADVREAFLQRSSLQDVDLMDADIRNAFLDRADLGGADLFNADFGESRLGGTRFAGARLNSGTEFDSYVPGDPAREDNTNQQAGFLEAINVYRRLERVHSENLLDDRTTDYAVRRRRLEQRLAWKERRWGEYLILRLQNLAVRYGRNPFRALAVSLLAILLFALVYPILGIVASGTTVTYPASITEVNAIVRTLRTGLLYSIRTFLPFVGPGAQPATDVAQAITALESLLGKLLLGLFGLDIAAQTGEENE
ncbi:pentapeptide repeat-containing protein [Halorubrum sp. BV1]|uniref:pentapeptide repeat-containing protein n=1 Tax=Halorubrum sp. BV1 TaxID=1498500 RepID=UPI0009B5CEB6|nr:pentapeptide repeat-containing protein [Halorubrum sp. BV1]